MSSPKPFPSQLLPRFTDNMANPNVVSYKSLCQQLRADNRHHVQPWINKNACIAYVVRGQGDKSARSSLDQGFVITDIPEWCRILTLYFFSRPSWPPKVQSIALLGVQGVRSQRLPMTFLLRLFRGAVWTKRNDSLNRLCRFERIDRDFLWAYFSHRTYFTILGILTPITLFFKSKDSSAANNSKRAINTRTTHIMYVVSSMA